ncbi:MAG: hypothetical protein Q3966_10045 [Neisseria sp.]|nr:hypothetical protein [Neisseria sp.]
MYMMQKILLLSAAFALSACTVENFDNGINVKPGQKTLSRGATDAMSAMLVRNSCQKLEARAYPLPEGTPDGTFISKPNPQNHNTYYYTVARRGYPSQFLQTFHAIGIPHIRFEINAAGEAEGWFTDYDNQGRLRRKILYKNGWMTRSQTYNVQTGQLERDNLIDCQAGTVTPAR